MFKAHKEIIWHLTCNCCKYYFTLASMDQRWTPRGFIHCPGCGKKQTVEENVTKLSQSVKKKK